MFNNKKIKDVVALNKRSLLRKNAELFTIEGTKMFEELELKLIEQVFVSETYYDKC